MEPASKNVSSALPHNPRAPHPTKPVHLPPDFPEVKHQLPTKPIKKVTSFSSLPLVPATLKYPLPKFPINARTFSPKPNKAITQQSLVPTKRKFTAAKEPVSATEIPIVTSKSALPDIDIEATHARGQDALSENKLERLLDGFKPAENWAAYEGNGMVDMELMKAFAADWEQSELELNNNKSEAKGESGTGGVIAPMGPLTAEEAKLRSSWQASKEEEEKDIAMRNSVAATLKLNLEQAATMRKMGVFPSLLAGFAMEAYQVDVEGKTKEEIDLEYQAADFLTLFGDFSDGFGN